MAGNPKVVYTGTFNPVHYGHLQAALEVQDNPGQIGYSGKAAVLFCPVSESIRGKQVVGLEHRLRMLELALKGRPGLQLLDLDFGLKTARTNYARLLAMREKGIFPDYWLIGSDGYTNNNLEATELNKVVLAGVPLIVVDRNGFEVEDFRFGVARADDEPEPITCLSESGLENGVIFLNKPKSHNNLYCGKLVERIAKGEDYSDMAPEEVVRYIAEKRLYVRP